MITAEGTAPHAGLTSDEERSMHRRTVASRKLARRLAWKDVLANKRATCAALLLVILPVTFLVVGVTMLGSLHSDRGAQLANPHQYNSLILRETGNFSGYAAAETGEDAALTLQEFDEIAQKTGHDYLASYGVTTGLATSDQEPVDVLFLGPDAENHLEVSLADGRWPSGPTEVVTSPTGSLGSKPIGSKVVVRAPGATSIFTVVGHGAGAVVDEHGRAVIPDVISRAAVDQAVPPFFDAWKWVTDDSLYRENSYEAVTFEDGHQTKRLWSYAGPGTYFASDNFEGKADYQVIDAARGVLTSVPMWIFFALVIGLVVSPALLLSARRHQHNLVLLGRTGGSPNDLGRVMDAQATALAVVSIVATALLSTVVLVAAEKTLRTPSIGMYTYGTKFSPVVWIFTAVCVLVSIRVSGRLLTDRALQSASAHVSSAPSRPRPSGCLFVLPWMAVAAIILPVTFLFGRFGVGLGFSAAVCMMVGALFLAPWLIMGIARAAKAAPLWVRFGLRDAARNQSRSVPLLGSVAAATAIAIISSGLFSQVTGDRTALGVANQNSMNTDYQTFYYGSGDVRDIVMHDVEASKKFDFVRSVAPMYATEGLPSGARSYKIGQEPIPSPFKIDPDSKKTNVLAAVHPSCVLGPTAAEGEAPVPSNSTAFLACKSSLTGSLETSRGVNGIYNLAVGIMTVDEAREAYSLSEDDAAAFAGGSALFERGTHTNANPADLPELKLLAWRSLDANSWGWRSAPPSGEQVVATIPVTPFHSQFSTNAVIVAPTTAERLGLTASPNAIRLGLPWLLSKEQATALNSELKMDVSRLMPTTREFSESFSKWDEIGLWIGGGLLFVVVALLTVFNTMQLRREASVVALLGGRRDFLRRAFAVQVGSLTAMGLVLGSVVGLAFALPQFLFSGESWESHPAHSFIMSVEWSTLAAVMGCVFVLGVLLAAAIAPVVAKTARRTS